MDYDKKLNSLRKFDEKDKAGFIYTYYHWLAYQLVAKKLGVWKWRYLTHDVEKPFLKILLGLQSMRKWHKHNRKHHLFYGRKHGVENIDYDAAVIDWEASRYTKNAAPYNAREEAGIIIANENNKYTKEEIEVFKEKIYKSLDKLGL